ncbi:MAG: co-chaperone YbbN [Nocardioides sp.]|uniref:co-chaperone YbbN n=1 Tax=Nocardioides sp. TaxID=35761 RepID=UPI003EFC5CDA
MTQQPFSRPGALDLSTLKQPAPARAGLDAGAPATGPAAVAATSYSVNVDEQNFQGVLESSMTAPVLLVFFSPTRMPESVTLASDLAAVAGEFEGRYLVGLVDIDAAPQIAQAMQIPSIPLVLAVVDGRPMPLLQDVLPPEELRQALESVAQQLTAQGIAGRHQPRSAAQTDGEEQVSDPRYAAADAALVSGDVDAAVAEYQKLVDANPADAEAAAGLARAKVLKRTQGADLNEARAAAAAAPDDVEAQILVADLDLLGGHVDDAFTRLINLVARTADPERSKARDHLIELFAAVGNEDPRVLVGRRNLASALF